MGGLVGNLQLVGGLFALLSGYFWMRAARVKVTWVLFGTFGGPHPDVIRELNRQGKFNRWAAWSAAMCAVCQSAALAFPQLRWPL